MIARSARSLPPGMPSPPSYQKVNPADQPILFLTLSSKTMPLSQVDEYAEIGARAAALDGQRRRRRQRVRRAEVRGADRRRSDAARRPARSASTRSRRRLPAANVNRPTGTLYGPQRNFVVQTSGQLMDAEGYRPIAGRLPQRQPGPAQRSRQRLRRRREPAQRELVQRHADHLSRDRPPAGHQHRQVVDAIKELLPQLQAQLPASLELRYPQRSLRLDPRVGRGRQVHAAV